MKRTIPLVSIIVVNFNGKKHLKGCFSSFQKLIYPQNRIEVILVDNCSTDDSIEFLKAKFPQVKILKNDINNYARANNLGIEKAKGKFIAFVNNDMKVERKWLTELINVIEQGDRIGAVGSKILLKNNQLQSAGHEEYPDFYWGDRGFRADNSDEYQEIEEVPSVCGGSVMYRRECLDDIGPFDEDFQMYLEDVDMCLRCAQKKWKVVYVPKSIVKHHFRGTSTEELVRYFSERNRLLLLAKHFPFRVGDSLCGKGYFLSTGRSIYDILPLVVDKLVQCHGYSQATKTLPSILKGLKDFSRLDRSILRDRIDEYKRLILQNEAQKDEALQEASITRNNQEAILREKEEAMIGCKVANAQLQERMDAGLKNMQAKDEALQEASITRNNQEAILREKEEAVTGLKVANAQLQERIDAALKNMQAKDEALQEASITRNNQETILREKEEAMTGLKVANAQLQERINTALKNRNNQETILREKEEAMSGFKTANAQLQERIDADLKDMQTKDADLQMKEMALAELNKAHGQTQDQLEAALKEIESKGMRIRDMGSRLEELSDKLRFADNDLERLIRFDQRIKILLIKPYKISVDQTEETVRIIKKKYPNASVYIFAHLLKDDYERLSRNEDIENGLLWGPNGCGPIIKMLRLFKGLYATQFDMTVTVLSRRKDERYKGYNKAKFLGMTINSKSVCQYYVD